MPGSEIVDVLVSGYPRCAFAKAHRDGCLLRLTTSGTVGRPRTVVRTTRSWVDSFPCVAGLLELGPTSRVWIPGPPTATMNLFAGVHADWAGAKLVDGPEEATHAHMTPPALRRQLARRPGDLAGVHVVTAGDRLDRPTHDAARAAGAQVSHYYGAAELSFVAWGEHADGLRPFPGVEVAARDGELWVRSPYVSEGYLEPDHVLRRDADGWMTVGDRGRVEDGLVTVLGREGGITTGATTVLVADVEHLLRRHAIGEVAVLGVPHPDLGEVVVAVVSRRDDLQSLRTVSRQLLDPPQRPRRWLHIDPLPLTDNGKIDRSAVATMTASLRP